MPRVSRRSNFPQIGGEGEQYHVVERGSGEPKYTPAGNPELAWRFPRAGMMKEGSPEHVAAVTNFLHSLRTAPPETVKRGLEWYPKVHEAVGKSITGRGSRGFLSSQSDKRLAASGLVAALSPNMDWDAANIHALGEIRSLKSEQWDAVARGGTHARGAVEGLSIAKAPIRNLQKAGRIVAGEHPEDVIPRGSAPKTHSFMHNIADPSDPNFVTIDARAYDTMTNRARPWEANRGIGGNPGAANPPTRYTSAHNVVVNTAERLGLVPSEAQAVSWEHTKYNIEQGGTTKRGTPRTQGPARVGQPYFHPQTGESAIHMTHLGGQFSHL